LDTNKNNETQIDIGLLVRKGLKNISLILIICALTAVCAYVFVTRAKTPVFTASTEVYVLNSASQTSTSYNDMLMSKQLTNDFENIITNITVTEQVRDKLGLSISPQTLASKIRVTNKTDTRILVISVTDADPFEAARIANCVRDTATSKIVEIMSLDAVNLISEARIPTVSSGTGALKYAVLAALVALVACFGVILLVTMFNDKIESPLDVEEQLGISNLGTIPYVEKTEAKKAKAQ